MADFFTRLADRARGTAQVVKPVIAPVFAAPVVSEPAPEVGIERHEGRQQQEMLLTPAIRSAAAQPPPAAPVSAPKSSPTPEPEQVLVPVVRISEMQSKEPSPPVIIPPPESPVQTPPVQEKERFPATRLHAERRTTIVYESAIVPAQTREIAVQMRPGKPPAPPPQPQAAAPQPIHINIERIEVRAIHPAAPSPIAGPVRTSTQPMPLDEYLKQQNGGRP